MRMCTASVRLMYGQRGSIQQDYQATQGDHGHQAIIEILYTLHYPLIPFPLPDFFGEGLQYIKIKSTHCRFL